MMLGARTAAWSGKALPYDAEVEWLKAGVNCGIDTGFMPEDTDVISWTGWADVHKSGMNVWCNLGFTSYIDEGTETTRIIRNNSLSSANRVYFRSRAASGGKLINFDNDVPHNFVLSCARVVVDGTEYTIPSPSSVSNRRSNYILLSSYSSYLSRWKLERGGETLMDAILVRIGIEGAMYDRVSRQLFRNAGTGAFIIGPDKTT